MATIAAVRSSPGPNIEQAFWEALTENDTATRITPAGVASFFASVQVTGAFGGATVVLQGSNDGSNWINLSDVDGSAISITGAGGVQFNSAYLYLRPFASGGTSQDVDITLIMRTQ